VRVIDQEGEALGVIPLEEALKKAEESNLDLVVVAPDSNPPVCKILDYGKYRYQQQKRVAQARKNQKVVELKEVILRPNIDENDFQVKLRNVRRFLESGNKVKVTLRFRGRELAHVDLGKKVIFRIRDIVLEEELGKIDYEPKREGRNMLMIISPAIAKK